MDIGLFVPLTAFNANAAFLRALGPAAEERGFESIWLPEHVVLFDDYESSYPYAEDGKFPGGAETGIVDPLIGLTYLAAVTDRVRLGTGILLLPQRNPVYTAKHVADLDVLSGGRVDLGIGIGWLEEEFDALNVPFAQRGKRTDEYLQNPPLVLDRTDVVVRRRPLHAPPGPDVPQAGAVAGADPRGWREPRRDATGGAPRAGLVHVQPNPGRAARGAVGARRSTRR